IGKPNVGKSTILNLLVNKKISIVTPKAQTTRNNILSVIDGEDYQIVIEDTPGLHKAKNTLGKSMNKKVGEAIKDSDIVVLIVASNEPISNINLASFLDKKIDIVVLNKIDLSRLPEVALAKDKLHELFPRAQIIEMCAKDGFNKDELINNIVKRLQDGPKYYPDASVLKDDVFFTKEIIREKILLLLDDEVPHNIAIYLKDIKHKKESMLIEANIVVNKDSQKGIVIGKNGRMIKTIGTKAREELEKYFKKRIFLNLFVKVKKDWLDSAKDLKELGY
ncbi:MAG: GTPase Era, partial [Bacilli bacterium]|nr:GTPase Era [Bacilli bacterium]